MDSQTTTAAETPAAPSGLRVREIKTAIVDGVVVPALDAAGREIEISAIVVPAEIEGDGSEAIVAHLALRAPSVPAARRAESRAASIVE